MTKPCDVLIVGAGPSGLALAADLAWRRVDVRIIDRAPGPPPHSRAVTLYPRTLELLDHLGVGPALIDGAVPIRALHVSTGRTRAELAIDDLPSRYPLLYGVPQAHTEETLRTRLADLGVEVERPLRATGLVEEDDLVAVPVEDADGAHHTLRARFVVGADGLQSTVRQSVGVPFERERGTECFDIADVDVVLDDETSGVDVVARIFLGPRGVVFVVPLPGTSRARLIVHQRVEGALASTPPTLADLQHTWRERVQDDRWRTATLRNPAWISRYMVQRHVAATVRKGRVLLIGDAAHVHSPVGAQGMNGGLHDAMNLGWKLALVVQGRATPALLDSYGAERLPSTIDVQRATDRLSRALTPRQTLLVTLRDKLLHHVADSREAQTRFLLHLAGLRFSCIDSPIVLDDGVWPATAARPGERLPDVSRGAGGVARLHDLLRHPDHTLLVFAGRHRVEALRDEVKAHPVVIVDDLDDCRDALGVGAADALLLVRPDGIIGCRAPAVSPGIVGAYFSTLRRG